MNCSANNAAATKDQQKKKRSSFVITQYIPKSEKEIQFLTNATSPTQSSIGQFTTNTSISATNPVSTNYYKNKRIYSTKKLFNEKTDVLSVECNPLLNSDDIVTSPFKKLKHSPTTPTHYALPIYPSSKLHSEQFAVEKPILFTPSMFPSSIPHNHCSSSQSSIATLSSNPSLQKDTANNFPQVPKEDYRMKIGNIVHEDSKCNGKDAVQEFLYALSLNQ